MDPEECRLAALHYFKESHGFPPMKSDHWDDIRQFADFIMDGRIPGEKAGLAFPPRREAN